MEYFKDALYCSVFTIFLIFITLSGLALIFYVKQLYRENEKVKQTNNYNSINDLINKILFAFTFISTILIFAVETLFKINFEHFLIIAFESIIFLSLIILYFLFVIILKSFIIKILRFIKRFNKVYKFNKSIYNKR